MADKELRFLKERNSWEGETWFFFLRATPEQFDKLRKLISHPYASAYSLSEVTVSESEANVLVSTSRLRISGYMPKYQDFGVLGDLPEKIDWETSDPFYKGKIQNFCTALDAPVETKQDT